MADPRQHLAHRRALLGEQTPACQRRPRHDRVPVLLMKRQIAIGERRQMHRADLDLVRDQRRVHRRLQQAPVPGPEVRHAHRPHLARGHQASSARPVSAWSINGSGRWISKRSIRSVAIRLSEFSTQEVI
jgi:hypothetical protein